MARTQVGVDMVGYPIFEGDVVFDGNRPWRVQSASAGGELQAVDAHASEAALTALDPSAVVRVRAERIDDYEYMRSIMRQGRIISEFSKD